MTYNFDRDRWFENELSYLKEKRAKEKLSQEEYETELNRLVERYEEMADRLDIRYDYTGK